MNNLKPTPSKDTLKKLVDNFNNRKFNEVVILGEQILKDCPSDAFVMNMLGLANFIIGKKPMPLIG